MPFDLPSYSIAYILAAGLGLVLTLIAAMRRGVPGSAPFSVLMLVGTVWVFFVILEDGAVELSGKILWAKFQYLGIPYVGASLLAFVLEYTRHDKWLSRRNLVILFTIPAATTILAATNELHHLIWTDIYFSPSNPRLAVYEHGVGFWVMVAYSYLATTASFICLFRTIRRSPRIYRRQAGALIAGAAATVLGNFIYLSGLSPVPGLDLTPFGIMIAGVIFSWLVIRYQLFELVPVAREALIETMQDAVLVVDKNGLVADANPAARSLCVFKDENLFGQSLGEACPALAGFAGINETQQEISLCDPETRYYDLRISPLYKGRQVTGRVIVLHDITPRRAEMQELERLYAMEKKRVKELNAVRSITITLSTEFELKSLLDSILRRALELIGVSTGELALYDPKNQDLELITTLGLERDHTGERMALGEGMMGRVAQTRQPLFIDDYASWEGRSAQYTDIGHVTSMGVPLLAGGELLGVISVGGGKPQERFSQDELELLNLFAQEAALAIRNARMFEQMRELATHDSLTGVFNRRHFYNLAHLEIERALRYHSSLTAIMLDIDDFKKVNDMYGHAAGDLALQMVTHLCQQSLRVNDIIGRYGGEEFAFMLPETSLEAARVVAERICRLVGETVFETPRGSARLTVSLGVAALDRRFPELDHLLDQADQAMYDAKKRRNAVRIFQGEI